MWTLGKKIMLGYAVCMIALVLLGLSVVLTLNSLLDTLRERANQREVLMQLQLVFSDLQDAETALRGFVLTGRPEYLEPYENARTNLPIHVNQLRVLAAGKRLESSIEGLVSSAREKMENVDFVVATRRDNGFEAASAMVASGNGKRLMDAVRVQMNLINAGEREVFARLVARSETTADRLKMAVFCGIPLAIGILFGTGLFLARHIANPVTRITLEAARIGGGDLATPIPPTSRQDEIGRLERSFESMRAALEENRLQLIERNASLSALNNKLEDMTRAKSEFLAMMSHEIRTPLHGLVGYSNLLSETPLNTQQQDFLTTIRASGLSLLTVINDVLDFSKIEAGKLIIEKEVFAVERRLREICELFRPAAADNGTTLTCQVASDVPELCCGDATRLGQVLANLVSNASKFTRNGSIEITAKHREHPDPKRFFLHVTVRDTGIGIPREKRGQLFKSFEQLDSSTNRKHGGTGLGLAICKRLCTLMDGRIWVDEAIADGTAFHFEIALEKASSADQKSDPSLAAETFDFRELSDCRVLVAEDNPVNASLLSLFLKKYGLTPEVVIDGRTASTRALDFDLVFMDVQMPEMDGITATVAIRKSRPDDGPYIIALTAEAMKGDAERCLNAGRNGFLSTPFRPSELDLALAKYCSHRAGRAS